MKAAQLRREEKARESKEKMMQEEDPDRQRRLEVSLKKLIETWSKIHIYSKYKPLFN